MQRRHVWLGLGALVGASTLAGALLALRTHGAATAPAPAARRLAPSIGPEPSADAPAPPVATEDSPLALGTHHPIDVLDADADERWAVVCQARDDTNHDGYIFSPAFSPGPGDRMRPYLLRGEGPGEPIDRYLGADLTGRFVTFARGDSLRVLDVTTGQERDLDPEHEVDREPEPSDRAPSRQVWFGPGVALMPVRSAARPGRALADWVDLVTGQRRRLDLGEGRLWQAAIDRSGAWVRAHIATVPDPSGGFRLPDLDRPTSGSIIDFPRTDRPADRSCHHVTQVWSDGLQGHEKREVERGYRVQWFEAGQATPRPPPAGTFTFAAHALPDHAQGLRSATGRVLRPFTDVVPPVVRLTDLLFDAALEGARGPTTRGHVRGPLHWARPRSARSAPPPEPWRAPPDGACVVYSPLTVTRQARPPRFAGELAAPAPGLRFADEEEERMARALSSPPPSGQLPGGADAPGQAPPPRPPRPALPRPEDAPPEAYVTSRLASHDAEMLGRYRRLLIATASGDAAPYLFPGGCDLCASLLEAGLPPRWRASCWESLASCEGPRFDRLFRGPGAPAEVREQRPERVAGEIERRCGEDPRRCRGATAPLFWSRRPEDRATRIAEATDCLQGRTSEPGGPASCLESLASVDWALARSLLARLPAGESRDEAARLLALFATREELEAKLRSLGLGEPLSGDANDWLLSDRVPHARLTMSSRRESFRFWDDLENNLYELARWPASPLAGAAMREPLGPWSDLRPTMLVHLDGEWFESTPEQLAEGLLASADPEAEPQALVQQAFVGFVNSIARHRGSDQRYLQMPGGTMLLQVTESTACAVRSMGLRRHVVSTYQ